VIGGYCRRIFLALSGTTPNGRLASGMNSPTSTGQTLVLSISAAIVLGAMGLGMVGWVKRREKQG